MMMPAIFGESFFDNLFGFSSERRAMPRRAQNFLRVDIKESDDSYELITDLPGFTKDQISVQLDKGYLTISAAQSSEETESENESGSYIRRERYYGSCQRSFYLGESTKMEDIKAEFHDGSLKLSIAKQQPEPEKIPDNYIPIEG